MNASIYRNKYFNSNTVKMENKKYNQFMKFLEGKNSSKKLGVYFIMPTNIKPHYTLNNIIISREKYLQQRKQTYFDEIGFVKKSYIKTEIDLLSNLLQPFLLFINLNKCNLTAAVTEVEISAFTINKLLNDCERQLINSGLNKSVAGKNFINHWKVLIDKISEEAQFVVESKCPLFLIIIEWINCMEKLSKK